MHGATVLKGQVLSFSGNPAVEGEKAISFWEKGAIVIEGGRISAVGDDLTFPATSKLVDYGDHLICAGFVDGHVHYPQINVIASYGTQLLEWLDTYTFPEEIKYADPTIAEAASSFFLDEFLKNGFTTGAVYCTSQPVSVDVFFEEASKRDLRMIAGKVLMDRNAPKELLDTPQTGFDQSKALIDKWHGKGRNLYAITPRFAPTSSPEQLELAGALFKSTEGVYVQSHVSENVDEISWVQDLFPKASSYLDVYGEMGLLGPRTIYGHGIHLSDEEIEMAAATGTGIVHCPTSNLFIGSGLFQYQKLRAAGIPLALGTDIAGGSSLSPFAIMKAAYEISQLHGVSLPPEELFYAASLGGAKTLHLSDRIGRIATGYEADITVIDLNSTPMLRNRMKSAKTMSDQLFAQIILADDRAIRATYAAGKIVYDRE